VLQGEVNELKKQNESLAKEAESKKAQSNSASEIEDYFNKKR
jgi:FtsZ-binding cell division protein ZapB